jgi:hypothetical protein
MLDFPAVKDGKTTFPELVADLTRDDLCDLTNEMVDTMLNMIADCTDVDVTFQPVDPDAHDAFAEDEADVNLAWNLGHLVVHVTASAEESAALAAEMARGVPHHGRSRYELPWQTITTIQQCRDRLAESRRIRLASLDLWPDEPHFEIPYHVRYLDTDVNAIGRFVLGLRHDFNHLAQIADVISQAREARS